MTSVNGRFLRWYVAAVGAALAVAALIGLIGYWPTIRFGGREAVPAMAVGCGISWIAGCVGAVPLAWATARRSAQQANAILVSTGARFITVLVLIVPAAFSGWLDRTALAVWVAISYLLLLVVDTTFAVRLTNRADRETG